VKIKDLSEIIEEHNIKFIGPRSEHIKMMGNKIDAKKIMDDSGVPTVKGINNIDDKNKIKEFIRNVKFPIIVKAASGGGGKGMRVVTENDDLDKAIKEAKIEAKKSFNDENLYLEKFLTSPKHIEIQVLCDAFGNVVTLGERDCSIQRKHQKLIEESPSSVLTQKDRERISELCRKAMKEIGYEGVGTLEFLYENNEFYFMEMNTRLQVEHPVTEMVTGIDLVKEQILVANGDKLKISQEDVSLNGSSIECRINAEHPESFIPSPGKITQYHQPGGLGIRVDSAVYDGYSIPSHYDSNDR
jgi:Acetyl/propionyl-CoA carboxylase, alpha subunit